MAGAAAYLPVAGSAAALGCFTDTSQADFLAGVATNVDLNTSPGDAALSSGPVIDQQNSAGTTTGTGFSTPAWTGQTFIPSLTGQLEQADVQLFCNGCGATPPDLTLSVRATSAGLPTGADLASTTIPGATFANGATATFSATFSSPATLTSGTQYALILHPVSAPAGSGYFWIRSSPSTYASGSRVLSANSGATWSADTTRDYNFKTYINPGYAASGTLASSVKDAGSALDWNTISWTSLVPASTSLRFQAAAAADAAGPFAYVGPDGTAATYFDASGASLSQFNGFRYLKYKAYLATADGAVTPVLSDATVCYVPQADLSITKTDGVTTATAGGSVTYTITASNAGPSTASGATVTDTFPAALTGTWTCVGAGGGTCTASGNGNINDTVNLPVAGSVTYTVSASIHASAAGTLSNTATVSVPAGMTDPVPGNNSATDTDTLAQAADLSVTVTDGVTTAAAGGAVTYTITASNAGPSNATGATVADLFPASLAVTWTCVGAGGGTCTASSSGNINDLINLPVGGSVTYTAAAAISASATGVLSNTATVAAPAGVADPSPANNSATDTDTLSAAGSQRTAIPTRRAGVTVDLVVQGCSSIDSAAFIDPPAGAPSGVQFPFGLIDFSLSGCAAQATVTTTYSQDLPQGATFYKEQNGSYAGYPATLGTRSITFTLTDNGLGDSNPVAGQIHDPSGLAVAVAAVPTLTEWGAALLAAALALLGSGMRRRCRGA